MVHHYRSFFFSPATDVEQVISAEHIVLLLGLANVEKVVRDATRSTHHWGALFGRRPFGKWND